MQQSETSFSKWHKVKVSELNATPSAKINVWKIVDMSEWCRKNVSGEWHRDYDTFYFVNQQDASLFIQAWLR